MFVVDTNVISELRLPAKANPQVLTWSKTVTFDQIFLSVMSILELEVGVLRLGRKDKVRAHILREWLDVEIAPNFSGRILAVNEPIARVCASLHIPKTRSDRDALIAATAIVHGMTVVTRNVADFKIPGVRVLNPWTT
jgi:toxin FitB